MTLREAEKAVLEAADRWATEDPSRVTRNAQDLERAVRAWRRIKSAGKPKARCYCGKTVSIEGDNLRSHRTPDGDLHAPSQHYALARGGKLL